MFIAWQDTWETMVTYARYQMLQLWLLGIGRLYLNLLSPLTLAVISASGAVLFFIPKISIILGLVQMLWIARLVYLARPSVGLKNKAYRMLFLTHDVSLSVGAYVLAVGVLCALLSWYGWVVLVGISPLFFLFLYDQKHQFPGNFLYALRQTGSMMWALAPLLAGWILVLELLYLLTHLLPHGHLIYLACIVPVHVALMTLVYTVSLHKHFEWYYA